MKLIWRFIRPHWKLFTLTVLLLVIDVAGSLLIPTLAAQMLNLGISAHSFQKLIETGLWMAAASLVSSICAILGGYACAALSARVGQDMRVAVYDKSLKLSVYDFRQFGTASITTRTISDITNIQMALTSFIQMVLPVPVIIVLAVILTFNLDVQFGFVLLCTVAAVLILALFIMRSASPLFRKLQKLLDRMSKILLENITGVRVVRAFNNEQRFGYQPGRLLMKDISFTAQPGQKIAIVGSTGAGKTTLVNLLMRFYEVNGGVISIDGVSTSDMTRKGLRSNFDMVLQDTWLFEGTVAENIAYGKADASREEIIDAAKAAKVDYFIRTMPHGYDTVLDNEASALSAGQRQLLTIARVFLCDPPILILDEATSSVDMRTETEIGKAMNQLMKGRTSFIIAHRLSTIRDADTILFMDHGNIIEQGSHEELLKKNGAYAALYYSQFE